MTWELVKWRGVEKDRKRYLQDRENRKKLGRNIRQLGGRRLMKSGDRDDDESSGAN